MDTILVVGSCVSREPFNYHPLNNICVNKYIHKCSLLFDNTPPEGFPLLEESEINFSYRFVRRSVCQLLNGTYFKELKEFHASYLIFDNYYFDKPLYQLSYPNGIRRILQIPNEIEQEVIRIISTNKKYHGCSIIKLDALPNYPYLIDILSKKLSSQKFKCMILLDAVPSSFMIKENGKKELYPAYDSFNKNFATQLLLEKLQCSFIPIPTETYCDYYKYNNYTRVHYGNEIYEYLSNMIHLFLTKKNNSEKESKKFTTRLRIQMLFITNGLMVPLANLLGQIENQKNTDDPSKIERNYQMLHRIVNDPVFNKMMTVCQTDKAIKTLQQYKPKQRNP